MAVCTRVSAIDFSPILWIALAGLLELIIHAAGREGIQYLSSNIALFVSYSLQPVDKWLPLILNCSLLTGNCKITWSPIKMEGAGGWVRTLNSCGFAGMAYPITFLRTSLMPSALQHLNCLAKQHTTLYYATFYTKYLLIDTLNIRDISTIISVKTDN